MFISCQLDEFSSRVPPCAPLTFHCLGLGMPFWNIVMDSKTQLVTAEKWLAHPFLFNAILPPDYVLGLGCHQGVVIPSQ